MFEINKVTIKKSVKSVTFVTFLVSSLLRDVMLLVVSMTINNQQSEDKLKNIEQKVTIENDENLLPLTTYLFRRTLFVTF